MALWIRAVFALAQIVVVIAKMNTLAPHLKT